MAKKVVDQLVTELTADSAKMRSEFNKSVQDTKAWGKKVSAIVATVGAGFSIKSLVDEIKETAQYSVEIKNLARVADVSAGEMQKLAFASAKYGVEQDKVADILKDVNEKIGDFLVTGAGPMADFFETVGPQVGVTADNFKNLNGRDALQLYVSSLEKANLSQKEMTFFMEAIASDATMLLPLFRDNGRELDALSKKAERLGVVISDTELEAFQDTKKSFDELGVTFDVFTRKVATGAMPAVNDLVKLLSDESNIESAQSLANGIVKAFGAATEAIATTVEVTKFLGEELAATFNGPALNDIVRIEDQIKEVETLLNGNLFEKANRLRFFGKDGLVEYYDEQELQASLTYLKKARDDFYNQPVKPAPLINAPVAKPVANVPSAAGVSGKPVNDASYAQQKENEKLLASQRDYFDALYKERLSAEGNVIKLEELRAARQKAQLDEGLAKLRENGQLTESIEAEFRQAQLDAEAAHQARLQDLKARAAEQDNSAIESARSTFEALHSEREALAASEEELENKRFERQKKALEKEIELLRERGALTAEIQSEYRQAQLDAEVIHNEKLQEIVAAREAERRAVLETGYGAIFDLASSYYDGMQGKEAAYARTAISLAKTLSTEKGREALKEIWQNTYAAATGAYRALSVIPIVGPVLGAGAFTAVAATGAMAAAKVTGMAHDGIDSVPKTGTWILEKGERVTTQKTSAKLDSTLTDIQSNMRQSGMRGGSVNQTINVTGNVDNRTAAQIRCETERGQRMTARRLRA